MEALLSREHQPSAAFPIPAIDGETPRYVVGRSAATTRSLLEATESAWAKAQRITWGPEAIATSFRALWTSAGLAVRYDVTDPSPWHTLTQRDERLWNEEVVELFLDVGATGRSYAEIEWNPANAVVDLWVDRPGEPVRQGVERGRAREPGPREEGRRRAPDRLDGRGVPAVDGARGEGARRARRCRRSRAIAGASTSSASSAREGRRSPRRTRSTWPGRPRGTGASTSPSPSGSSSSPRRRAAPRAPRVPPPAPRRRVPRDATSRSPWA